MWTARNIMAGLFVTGLGLAFLWFGRGYPVGTVRTMGPGMFPVALACLTIAVGALIMLSDLIHGEGKAMNFRLRGVVAVLGALIVFALLLERAGLLVTGLVAVLILALGEGRLRLLEVGLVGLVLSVAIWAIFGRGLGMPIRLLPGGL